MYRPVHPFTAGKAAPNRTSQQTKKPTRSIFRRYAF